MLSEIKIPKKIELIMKLVTMFSIPFFTILLSNRYRQIHIFIGAVISFVCGVYIIFKKVDIKKIDCNKLFLSTFIGLYAIKEWLKHSDNNILLIKTVMNKILGITLNTQLVLKLLGIAAIPSIVLFIYIFIEKIFPRIKKFFSSLTKCEKKYLSIMLLIGTILSIVVTNYTTAFSKPYHDNKLEVYDVIYTSDSGSLVYEDTYFDVSFFENDIRQPLFGIFALPFSIPTRIISELCFFLKENFAYETLMTILQFILTTITTIMIGRLLKIKENEKKYLYLLFSCSFPYIIFNLLLEQYVIALFYLITGLYIYFNNPNKINYMYIGSTGTMLTSGIIFPAIIKFKNIKQWIKDIVKCFCAFISVVAIGGQIPQLFLAINRMRNLTSSFSGHITFKNKLYQFTNFIKGIFLANPGQKTIVYNHPSYQSVSFQVISMIGIALVLICVISYLINIKNKFAKTSILWILFSIIVLLIIGLGTVENGLVLYSLYFAWAYLSLYFLFLKKILKKEKFLQIGIIISCIIMLYFNINEFTNIIKFAIKYY